ncbi:hypothetical protein [Timonella sp. A28]|uniref:hypothetical protein n=1 Tax=Timonella sp. A28 TaxID=3442640 RepID=UPI003EBB016A
MMTSWWRTGSYFLIIGSWLALWVLILKEPMDKDVSSSLGQVAETVSLDAVLGLFMTVGLLTIPLSLFIDYMIGAVHALVASTLLLLSVRQSFYTEQYAHWASVTTWVMFATALCIVVTIFARQRNFHIFLEAQRSTLIRNTWQKTDVRKKLQGSVFDRSWSVILAVVVMSISLGFTFFEVAQAQNGRNGAEVVTATYVAENDDLFFMLSVPGQQEPTCALSFLEGVAPGESVQVLYNDDNHWCEELAAPFDPFMPLLFFFIGFVYLCVRQVRYTMWRRLKTSAADAMRGTEIALTGFTRRAGLDTQHNMRVVNHADTAIQWFDTRRTPIWGITARSNRTQYSAPPQHIFASVHRDSAGTVQGFIGRARSSFRAVELLASPDNQAVYQESKSALINESFVIEGSARYGYLVVYTPKLGTMSIVENCALARG